MKMTVLNNALQRIGGGAAVVLLATFFGSLPAQAGIADTKHNLSSGAGATSVNKVGAIAGSTEICVFCHTPHGSDTSASVPLWNKKMNSPTAYTTYNSLGTSSLDGATAPVGSVSLACLSCHDGTQALNVMLNIPGSGGYDSTGAGIFGTMTGANQTSNKLKSGAIANIGVDLRNDHPIGIQYAGGPSGSIPASGTDYTSANFMDKDFKTAKSVDLNSQTVWWVENGTTGREKTDMQLYTRDNSATLKKDQTAGTALTGMQPFVECASCHDPHSANTTFLRIENTNSNVCLACHIK
jgi:predicted CXXCH cytochrome family protein